MIMSRQSARGNSRTWAATSRSASSSGSTDSSQSLARGFHILDGDVVVVVVVAVEEEDGEDDDGEGDGCSGSPQKGIVCEIISRHIIPVPVSNRIISVLTSHQISSCIIPNQTKPYHILSLIPYCIVCVMSCIIPVSHRMVSHHTVSYRMYI